MTIWSQEGMIKAAIAFSSVLFSMSCACAQQPSFPFLQDGGARDSFVKGTNARSGRRNSSNMCQRA
jgi:hypothetical protein